jgi:hypothetical protein
MSCRENKNKRLRQHYDAALRRWGQLLLSADSNLVGAVARQAAAIRQTAFEERNAAKERLDSHTLTCPACNPELRAIHKA